MLSHKNMVSNILQNYEVDTRSNLTWEKDKMLGVLPFFHVYGLTSRLPSASTNALLC